MYSDLNDEERDDNTGCTVCREDQVELSITDIPIFKVCRYIADDIQYALEQSINSGQVILDVVGYRVGKTKGKLDAENNRTVFSNHSFGTAIDVNTKYNGLYDNCIVYSSACRLIRGGKWNVNQAESISKASPLVFNMKYIGYLWGGEIKGKQKDFMHFSVTGY